MTHPTVYKYRSPIKLQRLRMTLLALPFVVYVFLFRYVPLMGWALALFNYKPGLPFDRIPFVGLKYFSLIFMYWDDVLNALTNTFAMSILSLLVMPAPIIFAILLGELRSGSLKRLVQSTVTLPHFVSWVIVYALAFNIFSSEGLLNRILLDLKLSGPTRFLANANTAWLFMTSLGLWKGLGWNSIVYLAAISGIDTTLYEAARVDGAGRFRCIWHITIPGIIPTFIVLLLLHVGNLLSVGFEQYLVFNNPMMAEKLEVLDMFVYRIGIGTQDFSFATAIGILKSAVSLTLLYAANSLARRVRGESII